MNYYNEHQQLAQVDENDQIVGKIDKWEAHKKGILHRAFTICLFVNGKIILQHRKHPVFNGVFDLTCSSHPIYVDDRLQSLEEAGYIALQREWNISKEMLQDKLENKGSTYYKSKDILSEHMEHEVCYLLSGAVKAIPAFVQDYSYGFTLVEKNLLKEDSFPLRRSFAPWVSPLLDLL